MVNLAIVKHKTAYYMDSFTYSHLVYWGKKRKANENNDFILCLFYSKTTGTNPALKDYC